MIVNLAHPRPVKWNIIIEAVRAAVVDAVRMDHDCLPLIPFSEWFELLMAKAENVEPEGLEIMVIVSFPLWGSAYAISD